MRWTWLLVLVMACVGCGKPTRNDAGPAAGPAPAKVLKAAICPTSPPNCFQRDKEYVGIDVDVINAFCKSRNYAIEMTAYDWSGMLGAVISDRADLAFSGISITEKRKETMDFSDTYMVNVLVIAAIAQRGIVINSTDDWKKHRLGFVRGMYFGDLIKTTYKSAYAYEDLKQYPSYNELLADLGNGKVDGAFMDSLVMADQAGKGIYALVAAFTLKEDDQFGFAFPKRSPLRDEFNQFLRGHTTELQATIDRYLKKSP